MSRKPPPPVFGWWPTRAKSAHEPLRAFDKKSQFYCPECHPTGPAYSPTKRAIPLEPPNRRSGYDNRYPDWFYYCGECGYPVKQLAECSSGVPFEMKQNSVAPPKPNTRGTMTLAQLKRKYGYVVPSASGERACIPPPPRPAREFGQRLRRSLSRIFCGYNNNHNSATIDPRGSMRAQAQASNYDRNWRNFGTVTQPRNSNSPHIIPWDDPPNATRSRSPAKSSRQAQPIRFHTTFQPNYQPSSSSYSGTTSTASSSKNDDHDDDSASSVAPEEEEEQASPVYYTPRGSSFAANRNNQATPTSRFITGSYRPSARRQQTPWSGPNQVPHLNPNMNIIYATPVPGLKTPVGSYYTDPERYSTLYVAPPRKPSGSAASQRRSPYFQNNSYLQPSQPKQQTTQQEQADQGYNQQTVSPGQRSTRGPSPFQAGLPQTTQRLSPSQTGTPFATPGQWSSQTGTSWATPRQWPSQTGTPYATPRATPRQNVPSSRASTVSSSGTFYSTHSTREPEHRTFNELQLSPEGTSPGTDQTSPASTSVDELLDLLDLFRSDEVD